jgi:hypothetical protein
MTLYYFRRRFAGLWIGAAALAGLGCSQAQPSNDRTQVQAAIVERLSERGDLDMNSMEVVVESLDIQGDKAVADTTFRASGSDQTMMRMRYNLERSGGGWRVLDAAAGGHGSPTGGEQGGPGSQTMPPGHPTVPQQQQPDLPRGHPPVSQ